MSHRTRSMILRFTMLCLCAAILLGTHGLTSYACEGEIEWETSPLINIVDVVYQECVEATPGLPEKTIRQRLRFRIDDGEPNESYEVWIHGRHVITLVTDSSGEAEREILRQGVRIGTDGRPRTANRIDDGDVCGIEVDGERYEAEFVRL